MQTQTAQIVPDRTKTKFDVGQGMGLMEANGMVVELNLPPALVGEKIHSLPPYGPRSAFQVDEYENCPASWPRSEVKDGVLFKSFFVPVRAGRGLWLDFNRCQSKKYVAAMISIQGVNAITGQKLKGEDIFLSQFVEKCPVHDVAFGAERHCPECGYKWMKQNYLANNAQPHGQFWLDGFRNQDGEVRQFIFTEEEMRSVAKAILGDQRCWAIGIAFYESKEEMPKPQGSILRTTSLGVSYNAGGAKGVGSVGSHVYYTGSATGQSMFPDDVDISCTLDDGHESLCLNDSEESTIKPAAAGGPTKSMADHGKLYSRRAMPAAAIPKKLEIGAGAKIQQRIWDDPKDLDFWQEKPSAVILINYISEDGIGEILDGPRIDLTAGGEGFLADIPKGNPPKKIQEMSDPMILPKKK